MTDVKITGTIPNNVTKVSYNVSGDIVRVKLQDSGSHTLLTQPIRIKEDAIVSNVSFSKTFNTITIKFEDTTEITIPVGKHLLLTNGDLELVRGIDCVQQQIETGLHILLGDWVLDSTAGIDYFGGMRAYPEILNAQIKKAINTVENVDTVLKYKFIEDNNNVFNVSGTVKVGNSEIPINNKIMPMAKG